MSVNGKKRTRDDADDWNWTKTDLQYVQQTLGEVERMLNLMESRYDAKLAQLNERRNEDLDRIRQLLRILRSY